MFDIAPSELLLVAVIALVVIGPKDLPRAMRFVGQWVSKARGVARHFRTGIDEMIRQAELEEMEKKWAAENERIMREHPAQAVIEHAPITEQSAHEQPVVEQSPAAGHPSITPAAIEHEPTVESIPAADTDMVKIADTAQASLPLDTPVSAKPAPRKRKPKPAADA